MQGYFGLDLSDGALIDKLHEVLAVLDFEAVERTADSLKQGGLTTAVRAADKNNGAFLVNAQIEVEVKIGFVVADFDSLN
ncbi:unknown [Prevotella sp. CAG:873]|nr:unknown [Prevotella sp. CAG:873]